MLKAIIQTTLNVLTPVPMHGKRGYRRGYRCAIDMLDYYGPCHPVAQGWWSYSEHDRTAYDRGVMDALRDGGMEAA